MAGTSGKLDKLEALYRINESVLSILEVNKLLERVLHIMEDTFGFDSSAVLFLDDKTDELYIRAARGYSPEAVKKFRTTVGGQGITGHVAKSRKPLFIQNIEEDARYVSGVEGAKSEIAIPLVVEDRLLGVLDIESKKEYSFTKHDFEVLIAFASQIALAINNALVLESERKRSSQLLVFNEIRKRVSLSLELDMLLQVIASSVIEFLNYYQILIFLRPEEGDGLVLKAQAGIEDLELDESINERVDGFIVGAAFSDRRTVAVRNVHSSSFKDSVIGGVGAELAIPLTIQRRPVGVLYIASRNRGAFDDKDIHILETICDQLTLIMRDTFVFSDISKKSKHSEIIRKISQVAIQSFDLRRFIDEVVQLVHRVFGLSSVSVFSYEAVSNELELVAFAGTELTTLKVGDKLPLNHGIIGYVARTKEYCLCNDVVSDARYRDVLIDTKSELTVPVKRDDEVLAVMNIESPRLNQFDRSDIKIFERIADQVAYTITNAELFRLKTTAHNLLLGLNELSRKINSSFDLSSTISTVARELPALVGCRLCSIFFYHEDRQELELMGHNFPTEIDSEEPIALDESSNVLMGKVIKFKHSIHIQDIEQELNIPNRPQYQTKSFLNILLCQEERIIGVLNLTDKLDGSHFSSEEFYLVNSFSEHLVNAIANAERYERILQLSVTDGLTGLYVHRYFQSALSNEVARANRHGLPLSLVMLDVDDFKKFNDTYGHQVGDVVLRELALIIRRTAREYDIAARYGGEEFGIILPSTSLFQANRLAKRLREAIEGTVVVSSRRKLRVTVSQGVSEHEIGGDRDELIRRADLALLQAKRAGKNQVVVFDDLQRVE